MPKINLTSSRAMRWLAGFLLAAAVVVVGPMDYTTSAAGAKPGKAGFVPQSFTELAKNASPAVVNIRTVKTVEGGGQAFRHFFQGPDGGGSPHDMFDDFFKRFFNEDPREFKQKSLGSGFIIDKAGHIVTNHHVIKDADEIQVKLKNGHEYDAELKGTDPSTDLALIQIQADKNDKKLPVLEFGDSKDLQIGQWIIAIGNPFGLEHTVTAGIVSAKGRVIGAGPYDDFIQTDASINPGNSGGPLINMEGEVVGINTAIVASGQGIGFAIPTAMATDIIHQLQKRGEVTRGWLGVGIQDLDEELKAYYRVDHGVLVTQVFEGDPAEKAGIKPQDIIVSVNGKAVDSARELSKAVAELDVGEAAGLKINRKGDTRTIEVKIGKRDKDRMASMQSKSREEASDALGIEVAKITENMAERFNLPNRQGVIVADVAADSKAAEAGIRKGDIIQEINHERVNSVADYEAAIDKVDEGETLQFYIKRAQRGYIVVKLAK